MDLSSLDEALASSGTDGYLIRAPGDDPDQRYLSGFPAPDAFLSLYVDGEIHLLVRGLDRGLARERSRAATVASGTDYDHDELLEEHGAAEADRRLVARFVRAHGVEAVTVPEDFPIATADGLRDMGVAVHPDEDDLIGTLREIKSEAEIESISRTQRATERAMRSAEALLADADVVEGTLHRDDEPLTSERLKREIEVTLVRNGCFTDETIVAGGADAAVPHDRGSGPLPAGEPIVIDIFPRHRETKYHADMTRTFCVGEPTETAAEWYELTRTAHEAAIERIEPGVTGEAVHDAVCDVYEDAGHQTLRMNRSAETGFIHGTGHGVGLEVHEGPRLSFHGGELEAGHVVTVEPGLYDPSVGGIRIEDLLVVTEEGCRNLTDYPKEFVV